MPKSTLTFIDPVCGMEVSVSNAAHQYHYNGEMYYFCSVACYLQFTEEPERYGETEEEVLE